MVKEEGHDDEAKKLEDAATKLLESIGVLGGRTAVQLNQLAHTARTNRRLIYGLAFSLALDVVLTVVLSLGIVQINNNANRIDEIQQTTSKEVLCPLYQQFINADTPAQRELAKKNGQNLKDRDEAFRVIHHGYDILGCNGLK